jgi:methylmalonyl-CoA mutase
MTGLAADFAPASEEQWRKLVEGVLKGGAFEKLLSRSDDAVTIQPIYARRVGPRALRSKQSWRVTARVDHPAAAAANALALEDLAGGADGLEIIFAGAAGAYGYGLASHDADRLDILFEGVLFDVGMTLELDLGSSAEDQALAVAGSLERRGAPIPTLDLCFGLDPLGLLARTGLAGEDWSDAAQRLGRFALALKARGFTGPFVAADGRCVHAAGGSQAQELAFAISAGLDYLRALEGAGFAREVARDAIAFRLAADADEFMSLAKFRALRLLWARIEEASGLAARPARIHAEAAWRMMSARDPWVNVLRGAMAVFSAGLGGADSVSVLPFTQAIGLPDSFARRLARNSQLVLLEESHLGFVADPAAGAGAFEALTQTLCEKAWSLFQGLEAQGGLQSALERGDFQKEVAKVAAVRARDIARRKTPLTGVSDFPDLSEVKVETLGVARPAFAYAGQKRAEPLAPHRLAEPFEALRDASDAALARKGRRPTIFLANLGPIAAFSARATFAKSLFESGGVAAPGNDGFANASEASAAFKASGATIACVCSSDAVYAEMAEEAAHALKNAGARMVFLAGKPGERGTALKEAGVDEFVFAGCDALGALRAVHDSLALAV